MNLTSAFLLPWMVLVSNPAVRGDDRPAGADDRVQNYQRLREQEMTSLNQKFHQSLDQYYKKLAGALTAAQKAGDKKEFDLIKAEEDQIGIAIRSNTVATVDVLANPPEGLLVKKARAEFDGSQFTMFTASGKKISEAKKRCVKDLRDNAMLAFKAGKTVEDARLTRLASDLEDDQSDIPQPPAAPVNNNPSLDNVVLPDSVWQGRMIWDKITGDGARNWYCNMTVTQQGNGTFSGRMDMGGDGHAPWNLVIQGTYHGETLTFNNCKAGNLALTMTGTLNANNELDLKWSGPDGHNRARTGTATLKLKKAGNASKPAVAAR